VSAVPPRRPQDAGNKVVGNDAAIESAALASEKLKPFIDGKTVKKIIVVPKRMVNIAVG
jgi:leucyl-tRNA synthetase